MAWKRYPAYRDSGVAWLGEVPAPWQLRKLRECGRIFGGLTPSMDDLSFWNGSIPWITPKDMKRPVLADAQMHVTEKALEETRLPIVPPNSVLLVVRGMILAKRVPIARTAVAATVNQDMKAIIPVDDIDPSFLVYLLESANEAFVPLIEEAGHGTKRLPTERWRQISFAFPAKEEQSVIVTYLDRETARIDALIARKERLIALLQEKRAALISRAVTQGLDPSALMKDSGIAWLGEVPSQWIVAPLHSRYHVQLGKMLDGAQITGEHLAPYLRNVDVQWDSINISALPEMDFSAEDRQRFALRNGDLLVCEGGEVGRTAIWKGQLGECFYQKALHRVRPIRRDASRYLYYCMVAAANMGVFEEGSDVSTIGHLTAIKLRKHRFPFPPVGEQIEIANHLDRETQELNTLISSVQGSNDLLKEYRTALISAAVTGKIDVRGEVPA